MFCSHCGVQIPDGSTFCPKCGTQVKAQASNQTTAQAQNNTAIQNNVSQPNTGKSKMAAGLLGIFLGVWGVHNFYLGYKTKAIIQVLLGTVGCILIIGPIISGIWGFIEGILILCGKISVDGNGVPLSSN